MTRLAKTLYLVYTKLVVRFFWRGGRVVEGSGLENRHSEQLSRVRIPLSPYFSFIGFFFGIDGARTRNFRLDRAAI
jgi:hypothetical protein